MSTKAQSKDSSFPDRISFIDVLRGVAVISMIWMHTADGWLDRSYRATEWWRRIVTFGGLAAPLFFTLAGVGLGLAWHATPKDQREGRLHSQLRRGLQLVVLGYGLRLQMWMLDAGGYRRLVHWFAASLLLSAYVIAYRALRPRTTAPARNWIAASALVSGGLLTIGATEPARLTGLLRVDVLQGLGVSTAIVCLVCLAWRTLIDRPAWLFAIGLLVAAATGWVRLWLPGPVPVPIAGYVAAWPIPPGTAATTLFPLFPWMAYAFVGAAFALIWSHTPTPRQTRALVWTAVGGALTAFLVAETQPWIHAGLKSHPLLTQLVRVTYRLGVAAALTLPSLWLGPTFAGKALRQLGSASLWVYWVHLEFAFGVLAWPIRHRLGLAGWLVGFAALSAAMVWLAVVVNTQVGRKHLRLITARWTRSPET